MAFETMDIATAMQYIRRNLRPKTSDLGKNTVRDYNLNPSYTKSYGPVQSIANASVTTYTGIGTGVFHDGLGIVTNVALWTIKKGGLYQFTINWTWGGNAVGDRAVTVLYNGAAYGPWADARTTTALGSSSGCLAATDLWNANDTFAFQVYQSSGGALNFQADVAFVYVGSQSVSPQ